MLTLGSFIKDAATGEGDVRTTGETHAGAVTRRMSAKGVAADVDKARIFDEQVAVFAGINRVAADSDTVATGQVHVVFLTSNDVAAVANRPGGRDESGFSLMRMFAPPGEPVAWIVLEAMVTSFTLAPSVVVLM